MSFSVVFKSCKDKALCKEALTEVSDLGLHSLLGLFTPILRIFKVHMKFSS